MSKRKRATWWKMFYHQRSTIESVANEDAGMGLKAAFAYFDGEEIQREDLSQSAYTVFCNFKDCIDEAQSDYKKSQADGKVGGNKRWGNC